MKNYIPMVIEHSSRGEVSYDIYSRLLKDRIIFIVGEINDCLSMSIVSQLLYLEFETDKKDIWMYINSPGGDINSGLSIYDTMNYIKSDINTIIIGQACSMAVILSSSGTKNKRFALPNSRIMMHQPIAGYYGKANDVRVHSREVLKIKDKINDILSDNTGYNVNKIEKDTINDKFMSSKEALRYGLIDKVLYSRDSYYD